MGLPTLGITERLTTWSQDGDAEGALVAGLLRALSVFRGAALAWALLGVALSTEHLDRPVVAGALVALMIVATLVFTIWPGSRSVFDPTAWPTVVMELVVGVVVLVGDGLVYSDMRPQSLPWSWPAAGVMAAGVAFGMRAGFVAALITGGASLVSEVLLLDRDSGWVSTFSKLGLWLLAGGFAGYIVARLRRAEAQISVARAREEVARQLHDGVLQTLAVIQRRSDDPELAALAREQEHDLRGYLSSSVDEPTPFEPELHRLARRYESIHGGAVSVLVANDLPELSPPTVAALIGAIGEALTNAGKHGEAERVTIYAEPADDDETAFVSVKDNGHGFNPAESTERIGLSRSVRGRLEELGGRVEITSTEGRGTEVRMWL
ncbi:MAG: hypothetical protein EX269_06970 [Acidimicrobiales bacterium]|nr:MAG: hypothetical protein EX269_06970 [Acidimicrobiales bacterium]